MERKIQLVYENTENQQKWTTMIQLSDACKSNRFSDMIRDENRVKTIRMSMNCSCEIFQEVIEFLKVKQKPNFCVEILGLATYLKIPTLTTLLLQDL